MPIPTSQLITTIESTAIRMPTRPGEWERLELPGIEANISTKITGAMVNNVGLTTLTEANTDAVIQRVIDIYRERDRPFQWWIGPNTKPHDLIERLKAAGAELFMTADGLATTDMHPDIPLNPNVRVEEVTDDTLDLASQIYARGFDFDNTHLRFDVARLWFETIQYAPPEFFGHNYVAYVDGIDEPIAAACLTQVPGERIAHLAGGSAPPEYRGKGAYRALLKRRFKDAAADGAEAMIVQCDRTTSSPICQKIGMKKLCDLELYLFETPDAPHRGEPNLG
jgi:hypothetical protein